jgi:hypothetical protein
MWTGKPIRVAGALSLCVSLILIGCDRGPLDSRSAQGNSNPEQAPDGARNPANWVDQFVSVSIVTPDGWKLDARRDGSGSVGYGSHATDYAVLPARAIDDAPRLAEKLMAKSMTTPPTGWHASVAIYWSGQSTAVTRYVSDEAAVRAAFDRALSAADAPRLTARWNNERRSGGRK